MSAKRCGRSWLHKVGTLLKTPARLPGIHHSISRMHFVQPGQKWCKKSCNVELSVFPGPALEGYMYVSLATHPYQFFTTLDRCLMHITVNMHHSVTVGHVQHAALGHVAESKQYGGLKNVTTEYQTWLYLWCKIEFLNKNFKKSERM